MAKRLSSEDEQAMTIRLPKHLHKQARRMALEEGLSVTEIIRRLLGGKVAQWEQSQRGGQSTN